ncbi:MAG: hypothetical protein AAFR11_07610 [Pseudomonadota bacterium]
MSKKPEKAEELFNRALELARSEPPDFAGAEQLLLQAQNIGLPKADYALGSWYFFGRHYDKNVDRGIALMTKAADAGVVDAALELAIAYERGEEVVQNYEAALLSYFQAALLNNAQACFEIHRFFYHGFVGVKSELLSEFWRKRAEALGYEDNES